MIGDRLLAKIDFRVAGGCWRWIAATTSQGYGNFWIAGSYVAAHRAVWEELVGPLSPNADLHHVCENTLCVNPDHLHPMSRSDHKAEHAIVVTHCPKGHPYDAANTYVPKRNGRRVCRACRAESERRRRAR